MRLGKEPTLIVQGVVAALIVVQSAAIPMAEWAHTLIAVLIVALGALVNRQAVTPVTAAPVASQTPSKPAP